MFSHQTIALSQNIKSVKIGFFTLRTHKKAGLPSPSLNAVEAYSDGMAIPQIYTRLKPYPSASIYKNFHIFNERQI